ncbi:hypothetical protein TNCV_2655421 [Trichonephila clavipes]|nr:hypothetical protein TNCV_2655421 [Trichonephila clavipes]
MSEVMVRNVANKFIKNVHKMLRLHAYKEQNMLKNTWREQEYCLYRRSLTYQGQADPSIASTVGGRSKEGPDCRPHRVLSIKQIFLRISQKTRHIRSLHAGGSVLTWRALVEIDRGKWSYEAQWVRGVVSLFCVTDPEFESWVGKRSTQPILPSGGP